MRLRLPAAARPDSCNAVGLSGNWCYTHLPEEVPVFVRAAAVIGTVVIAGSAFGEEVTLTPVRDNTIYQSNTGGQNSNALGAHLFCGFTAGSEARRALIRFDVSSIPPDAVIESVTIRLTFDRAGFAGGGLDTKIHRLVRAWGQGTSDAGEPGGMGTAPTPGDPTWSFSEFPNTSWSRPGGDFADDPSASLAAELGVQTWASTPGLVADVQGWLADPSTNHGWIVIGNETTPGSAMRMSSVEGLSPPVLTITYTAGGPACGTADFDGDGDVGTDADIEAFFACLAGDCCGTCFELGADFNADGDVGTDADIESFFRVLAGGEC
jgi:hypothetical protein